jgi:hypothetical protein
MSAFAALTGFVLWIAVLSFPLAVYFLVILVRRGREVQQERWADLRPVNEGKPEIDVQSKVTAPAPPKILPKKTG